METKLYELPDPENYPVGRTAARRQGLKYYWGRRPCKRNHHSLRSTQTGNCLLCRRGVPSTPSNAWRRPDPYAIEDASRDLAKATGQNVYQSFVRCAAGHDDPMRYVSNRLCVRCAAAASREQYRRRTGR